MFCLENFEQNVAGNEKHLSDDSCLLIHCERYFYNKIEKMFEIK